MTRIWDPYFRAHISDLNVGVRIWDPISSGAQSAARPVLPHTAVSWAPNCGGAENGGPELWLPVGPSCGAELWGQAMGLSNGAEWLGCPWGAEQWGRAKVLPMGGCGAEHRNGALPTWGVLGSLIKQGVPKPQKPRDDKGTMG